MHEFRQVVVRMRQGETDRSIGRTGLMGRSKAREVRRVAEVDRGLTGVRPAVVALSEKVGRRMVASTVR